MASFGTGTGLNGQILRLGLTNGGSDNFAFLPFSTIEMVNPATGEAKFVMRNDNAGGPTLASFTISTGQWYYFETTFTRSGSAAIDYEFEITPSSADGTLGSVLASDSAANIGGGLGGSSTELEKAIYGGFKGDSAYLNGASGTLDRFAVMFGGTEATVGFNFLGGNDLLSQPIEEFDGLIAIQRFYDRALDASEVSELSDGPEALNVGPVVSAGADQPGDTMSGLSLLATVADDGIPGGAPLTTRWAQASGPDAETAFPATAAFDDPTNLSTTVNFDVPGEYLLRVEADDSEIKVGDTALITVAFLDYAQWAAGIAFPPGEEASGANPDQDLFLNIWEWVYGYNPLQPDPSNPGFLFSHSTEGNSSKLILELDIPRDRQPDISFYESTNLQSWSLILDPEVTVVPVSDTHARWTLSYDIATNKPHAFLRASATE
jgi:hypothetical protein